MDIKPEERTAAEILRSYTSLLWHWAWLLILCAFLAGGFFYWRSKQHTPVYQAVTYIMIDAATSSQVGYVDSSQLATNQQLATTYVQVMTMSPVLGDIAKRLNLAYFPPTAYISVSLIQDTSLLRAVVTDTDPKRAALIANTLVKVFSDQVQADHASRYAETQKSLEAQKVNLEKEIQATVSSLAAMIALNQANNPSGTDTSTTTQSPQAILEQSQKQSALDGYRQSYNYVLQALEQVELLKAQSSSGIIQKAPAVVPRVPISPRPNRDGLLAAITGFLVAAGFVLLIDFFDDTIRDPAEIPHRWGVPILGTIINYPHDKNSLITAKQPRSPITEAFRSLRTNLQFASVSSPIRTLLVTSPSPEDGKTTVAVNLGSVIAQSGRKAVIVDADLRRPRVHRMLHISNQIGLTDLFIQADDHKGALQPTDIPGLHVITSGHHAPNPSELLGSERMSEILRQVSNRVDVVIVDAPPILMVTDALVLASRVDGVLIVIKPSVTKRAALKNLLEQLHQVNANVIGVVMNDVKMNHSRYYYYHGYYYSRKYGKSYQEKGYGNGNGENGNGYGNGFKLPTEVLAGTGRSFRKPGAFRNGGDQPEGNGN